MSLLAPARAAEISLVTVPYPPYYGPEMKNQGPIAEIAIAAFKNAGHEVTVKFMPWVRALKEAKSGGADGILGAWYLEEREEWFLYSDELPASELVLFKRRGSLPETFTTYDALKPYKIGIVRDYANPEAFTAANLNAVEFDSDLANLRALAREKTDLILVDKATARYILATQLPGFADALVPLEPPVQVWPLYVTISKATTDPQSKIADFNRGLGMLRADGKVEWILKKHGFH